MIVSATEASATVTDATTLSLAVAALLVSLLAAIVPAATGFQQRRRDDRAKRSEMYLELMELVERHGLWVVDRTYDLMESSHEDYQAQMPHRRTGQPDRIERVRARAIVSAYASRAVSKAFSNWQAALEAFEYKLDEFSFIAQEEGFENVAVSEAEPLRDAEMTARKNLADEVNAQLVGERRWRRT